MNRRAWIAIGAYIGIVLVVAAASIIFFTWRAGKTTGNPPPASTPSPTPVPTASEQKSIVKSIGETTIDYRLYGRIGSIDSEDTEGLHIGFVFDNDPLKTRIPMTLRYHEQGYKLFTYRQNFGATYTMRSLDSASLRQLVTKGAPLVELRVQFSKSALSEFNARLITAIEQANQGNWSAFPKDVLVADSIGIVR